LIHSRKIILEARDAHVVIMDEGMEETEVKVDITTDWERVGDRGEDPE
jgi:hypothetical protein